MDLSSAIDLSSLSQPKPAEPPLKPGQHRCVVPDGCGLLVTSIDPNDPAVHNTLVDCLDTCVPYVTLFSQARSAALEVADALQSAEDRLHALIAANNRLVEENDTLKADVKKYKPQMVPTRESVFAGADALRSSLISGGK